MIKDLVRAWKEGRLITKTVKEKKYFDHIDDLPVYNFAKLMKSELRYLWKNEKYMDKKYPRGLFLIVFQEMHYQFKYLNNKYLRNKAALAEYKSKFCRTKNYRWKNEMNTLQAKMDKEAKNSKEFDLNDFVDYIEQTLSTPLGSINVREMSTSRAFNLYNKAINKNKASQNGNS